MLPSGTVLNHLLPKTRTIDRRILKFDKLSITNIRASRFHTSLQGPFSGKKNMIVSSRQLPDNEFQGALKKGSLNIFMRTESLEPV